MRIDGESVTDAKDDEKGHMVDGKIVGQFGDIKDTKWHTLEFLVKVKAGQAGKDIKNIVFVDGDNIDEPDALKLEWEKFMMNAEEDKEKCEVGGTIVYTTKTRNKGSDSLVENLTINEPVLSMSQTA
ncbi:hypothetical protein J6TS1_45860 [Siminovitchia terrae]|uniref:Uncharacterized protein n=1 Tax=Siminovitchia terrae TaxID=1914933 RepID=A0ABQ4L359_SIMTE|nr:hypothetical protein [Siminovitchia terrae]GIN94060.1 hypothetical protein J22TS1_51110 [Siminovitchia terrae]GIN98716.1 hypothetical protein J6TS1_45860 [Siminovitchia terrae]